MTPGDVVVGILVGTQETKVRPAVVIASATYLAERLDVLVGILTTKLPKAPGSTDHILVDWLLSIRTDNPSLRIDGDRPSQHTRDWDSVKARVRAAFAI